MEMTLSGKNITIKSIHTATDEIIKHIDDRRKGITSSLKTRWPRFNRLCNGGIEPNVLFTVAGISGSGKSSFVNMLETDLIDLNPNETIIILSFSLEMMSSRQVGRKISTKLNKTTSELYSTNTKLSEEEFKDVKSAIDTLKTYDIHYVEEPVNAEQAELIIKNFQETFAKDKWLIVLFDHTLLINGSGSDKENIDDLQKRFVKRKKVGRTSIIQISQLNREIEKSDRINNPSAHYPMRSDLSTSDFMYQCSDYVGVIHRPELLGITKYGTRHLPVNEMLYFHLLKNREGEIGIIPFKNDLAHNNIVEAEKTT